MPWFKAEAEAVQSPGFIKTPLHNDILSEFTLLINVLSFTETPTIMEQFIMLVIPWLLVWKLKQFPHIDGIQIILQHLCFNSNVLGKFYLLFHNMILKLNKMSVSTVVGITQLDWGSYHKLLKSSNHY